VNMLSFDYYSFFPMNNYIDHRFNLNIFINK
jgi:hypothetical protein